MIIMIIQEKFPSQRFIIFQIDISHHKLRMLQEKKKKSIPRNFIKNIRAFAIMRKSYKYSYFSRGGGGKTNTKGNGRKKCELHWNSQQHRKL